MRRLKYTALHRAVLESRVAQVRILIEQCGADVNSRDLYGRTPLMLCSVLDNQRVAMAMARLLLAAEPDMSVKDDLGRTALAHACLFGREALVTHLAETRIIDPTEPDNDGCTPLHHAAVQGNSRVVCLLVRACAEGRSNVDCRNRLGCTPLMLACRLRRYHCALFLLLDGGASGFLKDDAHFLSALEWLRAAERLPPTVQLHQQQPEQAAPRRAETAPMLGSLRSSQQDGSQLPPRPTFFTEYSNLSSSSGGDRGSRGLGRRARTLSSFASPVSGQLRPAPLPLPLPFADSGPASRPTTVGSSQRSRSRYTSATGDTVYVNVDELSGREARDLLVERLRAQALEFPYPAPGAIAAATEALAARSRQTQRPSTRDLQSLRPPPRSSAVANACQLLGLYHAARTAPRPAQVLPQPQTQQQQQQLRDAGMRDEAGALADGGGGSGPSGSEAAAAAAAADERASDNSMLIARDRRASVLNHDANGAKKTVKFKDVAK